MASLNQADLRALEQTRQRLFQLTNSLASLQRNIQLGDPLPPWYDATNHEMNFPLMTKFLTFDSGAHRTSLQSLANIISQNLLSVSQHLSTHRELFASTAVYPLADFPGHTQENLLGQLLRKKLEPNVEDWVEQGRRIASEARPSDEAGPAGLTDEDLVELWDWAGRAANEEARKREWGDDFTLEERAMGVEHVVTGLRRKLDQDTEDESDDEDEARTGTDRMDVDQKPGQRTPGVDATQVTGHDSPGIGGAPVRMDHVLRFMCTGAEPMT